MSIPSRYFGRDEFACRCKCGFNTVDAELLHILIIVRKHFGQAVNIHCCARCKTHNKAVGGGERSKHLLGIAADFDVSRVSHRAVYEFLESKYSDRYGLSLYRWGIHLDVREVRARW